MHPLVSSCYRWTCHLMHTTLVKLDEIRHSPDAFQKTCLVALSLLQTLNFYKQTNYLPRLISVLDTANSLDFYGFCRLPRLFLCPYNAENIEAEALLDSLEETLHENWSLSSNDPSFGIQTLFVHLLAKGELRQLLKKMHSCHNSFRTPQEFKTVLSQQLQEALREGSPFEFNPDLIDLTALIIPLSESSLLQRLSDRLFIAVDLGCVPLFLNDWNLICLAKWAKQLGRFPLLSWLPNQSLDKWVRGALCLGFLIEAIESIRCLCWEVKNEQQAKQAIGLLAMSVAEFAFNSALFLQKEAPLVTVLALVAKSIGLLNFLCADPTTCLDENE